MLMVGKDRDEGQWKAAFSMVSQQPYTGSSASITCSLIFATKR